MEEPVQEPDASSPDDAPDRERPGLPQVPPGAGSSASVGASPAPRGAPVPPDGPDTASRKERSAGRRAMMLRWWRSPPLRWAIAIVVFLFILEYALLPDIANARKSLHDLAQVNIVVLFVAVALEVASLLAYAELTRTVLSPDAPKRNVVFRVNMSSLALSHVVPGGTAPGTAMAYRLFTELDVPSGTAAFALATQGVGSAVVLNAIFWFVLLISIPLTGYNPAYGFAAIIGLILFALFAGTVLLLTRGQRRALERLHGWAVKIPFVNADKATALVQTIADRLQILLRDRSLLIHATVWAAANWLLDAASLWVFVLAFHHVVSPVDLLVAYGLANILAVLPITPGGLGVVEGVLIPTLSGFHVPKVVATLGVLSYRLVNFWLPIPAGGAAYLSLRSRDDVKARRQLRIHLHRTHGNQDLGKSDGAASAAGESP
ncbi:MAG TPA: YbhN family protein [Acidimicrobiales bacterium]|nr:YbhN family protein [Acidimicrobiales bacterium]